MGETDREDGNSAPAQRRAAEGPKKSLSPAAERALAEAALRRAARAGAANEQASETLDRLGPTRYGDWEIKGIASDF